MSPIITRKEGSGVCNTVSINTCKVALVIIAMYCVQQPHPHKLEVKISVADETIKLNLEMNL